MDQKSFGMTFNEAESSRLILARALEWEALPVFGTRSVAPIALFWLPWWVVFLALAGCSVLWSPIRTRFVSLRAAMLVCFLNNIYITLVTNVTVAVIFFSTGRVALGFLSLCWTIVSTLLAFAYPPTRNTIIQDKLSEQLTNRSANSLG